ncbi:MAG: TerC family protein [Nitrospirae bacterium]|nr:TerC family protein [Nitrospirota bacterium]
MEYELLTRIAAEFHAFAPLDILTIATLAALEGILSVDNALVLAILVRPLPRAQQKKALTYGIVGAFVFRFIALVFASSLMKFVAFKLVGGGYLVYLAMKHMFFFTKEQAYHRQPKTMENFWKTVAVVELTDIAFSIDSITTAVAMTDKLLIVWAGGILGIIMLRFAAGFFIKLLEQLPALEDLAYQLIFFIGVKLSLEAFHVEMSHGIFWMMMGIITVLGSSLVYREYHQRTTRTGFHNHLLDRLKSGEASVDDVLAMEMVPREIVAYLRESGWMEIRKPEEKCGEQETP